MTGYELGTAQTFGSVAQTGREVESPTRKLGFAETDRTRVAYNSEEGQLYLFIARGSDNSLHIYREVDALENRWNAVAGDDSETENSTSKSAYSVNSGSLKYPLVTAKNTLLLPFVDNGRVYRLPDWGDSSPNTVVTGSAPLYWEHGIDANGDIYFGDYSGSSGDILKSTDDGQNWSTVANVSVISHIHGVAASPNSDLLAVTTGDGNSEIKHLNKDGTDVTSDNALGTYGDDGLQFVPVMSLGNGQTFGANYAQESFIYGSDSGVSLARGEVIQSSDGTTPAYGVNYACPDPDTERTRPYVTDIQRTPAGKIVALSQTGLLGVSPDGWWWEWVDIPFQHEDNFPANMVQTKSGIVACSTISLTKIPWSTIQSVEPKSTVYSTLSGNPQNTTESGVALLRLDLKGCKEIRAFGDSDASYEIQLEEVSRVDTSIKFTGSDALASDSSSPYEPDSGSRTPNTQRFNIQMFPISDASECEILAIRE